MSRIPQRRDAAGKPVAQSPAPPELVAHEHEAPAHILLVGQDIFQHQGMYLALAQAGHRLIRASDWMQALSIIEERNDLELIICNRAASDPIGLGLVHYLAQPHLLSSLPVIVVCREPDLHSLQGLLAEETVDFLNTPFSERELTLRVRKSLIQHRTVQQRLHSAQRDPLTGLYRRRAFMERLPREMSRARAAEMPLGLLYIDLDHLQELNDNHGHLTGNQVLQVFSRRLCTWVREGDLAARYGGEEFVVLAQGAGTKGIALMGERIRRTMEAAVLTRTGNYTVTVSVGAAVYRGDVHLSAENFVDQADKACHRAKAGGRNRLVLAH